MEYKSDIDIDDIEDEAIKEDLSEDSFEIEEDTDIDDIEDETIKEDLSEDSFEIEEDTDIDDIEDEAIKEDLSEDSLEIEDDIDINNTYEDTTVEDRVDFMENSGSVKVLKRDEIVLLSQGYKNINLILEAKADDYRDKGFCEDEIKEKLKSDKVEFQQEFLDDAFPNQHVSPAVFRGFEKNENKSLSVDSNYEDDFIGISQKTNIIDNFNLNEPFNTSYGIEELVSQGDFTNQQELQIDSSHLNKENAVKESYEADVTVALDGILTDSNEELQYEQNRILPSLGNVNEIDQSESNDETQINYNDIIEGIKEENIRQGFENIEIDTDVERLTSSLENFTDESWQGLTLDEKKESMKDLADYIVDVIKLDNPPNIEFVYTKKEDDYGGYDFSTNTLTVNEYMLHNSSEAADTIAHELWHAHQHECCTNPQNALHYQYQYNFDNYIDPELGQKSYEDQLVEAEARAFAKQFKDRLQSISER
ncbi:MAG: hypothetical protein GX675_06930 [Erysipelotrichaceae bacterium]|nr:hypothetical protein [Erysipelotrichaceae bacterium]